MTRLVLLIVLTLLSQTANAVLEGRHLHIGGDLQSFELHFDTGGHGHDRHHDDSQDHAHSEGETCLHHHCHAGHLAIVTGQFSPASDPQQQPFHYLRHCPDAAPSERLRPPIA
ncbi:hypothetical protein FCL40_11745 [Ferrimonas sediminicola]|uniref:Uncharacterized protein n=1 Tax=Ferrimonas sediminicola TaxID=2569538 RepID=A0A4U1BBS5_9GAMM|nr:hypothetical protein [Ferrimonas sediminicola]TKB48382.1 hypothetical protein FCL40_11745 [Ferrimonas sediminicola]